MTTIVHRPTKGSERFDKKQVELINPSFIIHYEKEGVLQLTLQLNF
jgi:hypothetical protein